MPAITRVGELDFGFAVRDLAFWDEDTLMLVTPAADVWRAVLEPRPGAAECLFTGQAVNAGLARAFDEKTMEPATGGYPCLAASARARAVVVNTHDVVLVACPVGTTFPARRRWGQRPAASAEPRLISEGWGEYYPPLAFSADGSRFSMEYQGLVVYDTDGWTYRHDEEASGVCAWHPRETRMLVLGRGGRVGWMDWTNLQTPAFREIGWLDDRAWPEGVALDPDEGGFLAAYGARLEWWRFDPLRLVHAAESPDGEVFGIVDSPAGNLIAVLGEDGARLWNAVTREPLADLLEEVTSLYFSPSGRRFVTRKLSIDNPSPAHGDLTECSFDLWDVAP